VIYYLLSAVLALVVIDLQVIVRERDISEVKGKDDEETELAVKSSNCNTSTSLILLHLLVKKTYLI